MNENDRPTGGNPPPPSFAPERSGLDGRMKEERTEARSTLSDSAKTMQGEAKEIGAQAQRLAGEQAEKAKEATVSHLDVFADALRAASDELGKNQSGPASEMVSNAASGLEGLTRSLHGQSTGEMVETVRDFGRQNPVAFLAGSVLAGLALGRFASVATTEPSRSSAGPRPNPNVTNTVSTATPVAVNRMPDGLEGSR